MWDHPEVLRSQLASGERILWAGKPRPGLLLRSSDLILIPVSLLWCGFAIFWESMVIGSNAPWFFRLWGIPFVLVGLYMVFGRFFFDALLRSKTIYGLTNQRVIIVRDLFGRRLTSIELRNLPDVTVTQRGSRGGDITFGTPPGMMYYWSAGWGSNRTGPPAFEMLDDVQDVYSKIRAAQAAAT